MENKVIEEETSKKKKKRRKRTLTPEQKRERIYLLLSIALEGLGNGVANVIVATTSLICLGVFVFAPILTISHYDIYTGMSETYSYSGIEVIFGFGYEHGNLIVTSPSAIIAVLCFISIFMAASFSLIVGWIRIKNFRFNWVSNFLVLIASVLGAIFPFLTAVPNFGFVGEYAREVYESPFYSAGLHAGSIIPGVFMILCSIFITLVMLLFAGLAIITYMARKNNKTHNANEKKEEEIVENNTVNENQDSKETEDKAFVEKEDNQDPILYV